MKELVKHIVQNIILLNGYLFPKSTSLHTDEVAFVVILDYNEQCIWAVMPLNDSVGNILCMVDFAQRNFSSI